MTVARRPSLDPDLEPAAQAHYARGLGSAAAAQAAVAEFGQPPTLAAAIVVDLVVLGMLTGRAISQPGTIAWAPAGLAAVASLARLVLASRAARRSLAARAALT